MLRLLAALALVASTVSAQTQTRAPIRPLGAIIAKAPITFDTLINVRGLSDGQTLVNDPIGHKLLAIDKTFSTFKIWSDTTGTAYNYGTQIAVTMPVAADSSVMLEQRSNALVMIDPHGGFGRVFALPKTSDAPSVALSTMYGGAGIDPKGRLVYFGRPEPVVIPNPGCSPTMPKLTADSVSLVRADFESRTIDTIARIRFSYLAGTLIPSTQEQGCWQWQRKIDVLPYHGDQWTLLEDGTIAIVRESDYHIDWIDINGKMTSTPKMPFDWRPISAEEKQKMIDSATVIRDSLAATRTIPANAPPGFKLPPPPPVLTPSEIPDYYPPTRLGSLRVDFDGNLWIPPTTSRDAKGGLLYDVVNRKGQVIERVQLPAGRSIAAFVPGGRVVLRTREGNKITLELASVR